MAKYTAANPRTRGASPPWPLLANRELRDLKWCFGGAVKVSARARLADRQLRSTPERLEARSTLPEASPGRLTAGAPRL